MQLELAFGVSCWSAQAGRVGEGWAVMEDFLPQTLTNSTCAIGFLPAPLFHPTCAPVLRVELQAVGTGRLEGFVGVDTGRKAYARAFAGFAVGPPLVREKIKAKPFGRCCSLKAVQHPGFTRLHPPLRPAFGCFLLSLLSFPP